MTSYELQKKIEEIRIPVILIQLKAIYNRDKPDDLPVIQLFNALANIIREREQP